MEEKKMKDTKIIDKRILLALQMLMDHGKGEDAVISFKAGCDDIPDIAITVEDVFSLIHRMEGANSELLGIVDRQKKTILEYNGKDAHQTAEIEALELELSQCNKVIETLANENAGLKERGRAVIDSLHETLDKKQAEIERLTERHLKLMQEHDEYGNLALERLCEIDELKEQNAELQKQVDELTEQRDNQAYIAEELVQEKHRWTEQTAKDTAKEVFAKIGELQIEHSNYHSMVFALERWLKERFSVEVE